MLLEGKTAVIYGGAGRVGRAVAHAFAREGARVFLAGRTLATLEEVAREIAEAGGAVETAVVDWTVPRELIARVPFDLVLAADVLYERASVAQLLSLMPRLASSAWLADPGRPAAGAFLEQADRRGWRAETRERGVVGLHRLRFDRSGG